MISQGHFAHATGVHSIVNRGCVHSGQYKLILLGPQMVDCA